MILTTTRKGKYPPISIPNKSWPTNKARPWYIRWKPRQIWFETVCSCCKNVGEIAAAALVGMRVVVAPAVVAVAAAGVDVENCMPNSLLSIRKMHHYN